MKKVVYGIALVLGFFLMTGEGSTTTPNIIGLAMFAYSVYKLELTTK